MKIIETIRTNVNELCKLNAVSQHEVCKAVGVSDGYFKRTREDFPVTILAKLASYFNVNVSQLLDEDYTNEIRRKAIDAEIARLTEARKALDTPPEIMTPPVEEKSNGK